MNTDVCKECARKCSQFVCCMCEYKDICACSKIEPQNDDGDECQDMEICPICGANIEVKDGEDNGYGELHLYWKCKNCGNSGKAIIDQHDNNAFIEHEID